MNRQQMHSCLETVAAYRASGQRVPEWAQANGISARALASWCSHAGRWQAKLDGAQSGSVARKNAGSNAGSGFVAAGLPPSTGAVVRVELQVGATRMQMHWPLGHVRELATLVREVAR